MVQETEERLVNVIIMSIESDFLRGIDFAGNRHLIHTLCRPNNAKIGPDCY